MARANDQSISLMKDHLPAQRYTLWLDAVFGVFDEWPDIDPHEVFALSPLGSNDHAFEVDEIRTATIQTFERSGQDLVTFSDRALGCGLRALVDNGFSDVAFSLRGSADVLAAFGHLYANCLSERSPRVLGCLSEPADPAAEQLAHITYMLWDITPLCHWPDARDHRVFAPLFLDMLERVIMTNNNPACIESALHGIGHASSYQRESDAVAYIDRRRETMIDAFLNRRRELRPELLDYAKAARSGMIL